jgi:enoyl-CoA hydratase
LRVPAYLSTVVGPRSDSSMQNKADKQPITIARTEDGIARIEINRPEQRNALSLEALECLGNAFAGLHAGSTLKCAILTGAGDRSFAAGGDLKEFAGYRSNEEAAHISRTGLRALDAVRQCPVPVYAAINGHALGGGAELAMACDFRIAKTTASIGFLQGKLHITTAWGGSADLLTLIGANRGLELLLTSRVMNMAEAKELGLIDQLVPEGMNLIEAVFEHAAQFLSKPAHVIQAFTQIVRAAKVHLRAAIEPVEHRCFVSTWVDQAHWAAVEQSLSAVKAPRAKL